MPARSWLHSDAPSLSLNGDWRFRLLPAAPGTRGRRVVLPAGETVEGVAAESYDDAAWDTAARPLPLGAPGGRTYGRPIYTNVQFPFPIDPPHVPDENPTGDYRRRFDLPAAGSTRRRRRSPCALTASSPATGCGSTAQEIGVGAGSRLAQEFDVTEPLRPGPNVMAVRVHQWSAASYLEDQDQWWLPGIFRDVTLLGPPRAAASTDVWLRTGWSAEPARARAPSTRKSPRRRRRSPSPCACPELGIDVDLDDSAADVHRPWCWSRRALDRRDPAAVRRHRVQQRPRRISLRPWLPHCGKSWATSSWSTGAAWCSTA